MGRIGEALREARESKGLSLRDAEDATKIRLRYLEHLENENFANLPGRAYVIGFLKTYAKYLQIEDQALVEEYKATYRSEEYLQTQRVKNTNSIEKDSQPKLYRALLIIFALALLVGTNFWYNQIRNKDLREENDPLFPDIIAGEKDPSQSPEIEPPDAESIEPNQSVSSSNLSDTIQVSVKISSEANSECWVNVISDSKKVFSGIMTAGEIKDFAADENLKITFGNAGVAQVIANGQDLGVLGTKGSVITKEFNKGDF